jgi:nucleoid-associated protein YgaU
MASRYIHTQISNNSNAGKRYYESTIYPNIKHSNTDMYIVVEQGDRLDILAKTYYGNSDLWWVIAVANNINDAVFHIQPGVQLRIPQNVGRILRDIEKLNK